MRETARVAVRETRQQQQQHGECNRERDGESCSERDKAASAATGREQSERDTVAVTGRGQQ